MFFDPEKISAAFGFDENIVPVALLPIGYAAEDAAPAPFHTDRRSLADISL
jgi:nitroreductase